MYYELFYEGKIKFISSCLIGNEKAAYYMNGTACLTSHRMIYMNSQSLTTNFSNRASKTRTICGNCCNKRLQEEKEANRENCK
ncbi:23189_t:CDS:2, partial [Gigaspora margarita]